VVGGVLLVAVCGGVAADEIVLASGPRVIGVIEQETAEEITVDIGIAPQLVFKRAQIQSIHRATAQENAALRAQWAQPVAEPAVPSTPSRALRANTPVAAGWHRGQRPPDFSASDLNGQVQSLRAYRNRVVLLHFWATWCPYCRNEIPKLKAIQQRWGFNRVAIVAVSVDEDLTQLRHFVRANALGYPVIADAHSQSRLASLVRVSGVPTTLVINGAGLVAERFEGSADLVGAVQRVLSQASR